MNDKPYIIITEKISKVMPVLPFATAAAALKKQVLAVVVEEDKDLFEEQYELEYCAD